MIIIITPFKAPQANFVAAQAIINCRGHSCDTINKSHSDAITFARSPTIILP